MKRLLMFRTTVIRPVTPFQDVNSPRINTRVIFVCLFKLVSSLPDASEETL